MQMNHIEINPRVCGGKPVIRGTRIPVAALVAQLAGGQSWKDILRGYPRNVASRRRRRPTSSPCRRHNNRQSGSAAGGLHGFRIMVQPGCRAPGARRNAT